MARSARGPIIAMAIATPLGGCTTTQHEAQRVRLDSARQRAALKLTQVRVGNQVVSPTATAELRADGRTAFVVTVRNRSRKPVTDLPISVGYTDAGGASVYLNSTANVNYFENHLPAIRAGRSLTWVFTTGRPVPADAHPFARVGLRASAPARLTEMNVRIELSYRHISGQNALQVHLNNPTSVPQYQLQVYAYTTRGGRYVGGGNATVADLGAGSKQRLRLRLVGAPSGQLHVEAEPTILQ